MKEEQKNIIKANNALVAGGGALTFFWVLNIFKEAYPAVKNFLTFYQPLGPLLGLFIISIIFFSLSMPLLMIFKIKSQGFAFLVFIAAIVIFTLMVFPPVFEPLAHTLAGNK